MWNPFKKVIPALRLYRVTTANGQFRVVAQDCWLEEVGGVACLNFTTLKAEGDKAAPTVAVFKIADVFAVESQQIDMQKIADDPR